MPEYTDTSCADCGYEDCECESDSTYSDYDDDYYDDCPAVDYTPHRLPTESALEPTLGFEVEFEHGSPTYDTASAAWAAQQGEDGFTCTVTGPAAA